MIITVGAEKGGVGKTRLATHIATMAARDGTDVILLDTDLQGSATSWNNHRKEAEAKVQLTVLPLPPSPARELASLAERYDLVVVDIGAQNYRTMLECALLSDLVLVPCGADQQEIESTCKVFDALKGVGPRHASGKVPSAVVLTRVSTVAKAKATADIRGFFAGEGIDVFQAQISSRSSWLVTGRTGLMVSEITGRERSEKAVEEMQAVYDEIIQRINASEAS